MPDPGALDTQLQGSRDFRPKNSMTLRGARGAGSSQRGAEAWGGSREEKREEG